MIRPQLTGDYTVAAAVDSLSNAIAFHPGDWSLDHREAWIYGIVVGWGSALPEVARAHQWDAAKVERLKRLYRALHSEFPR